MKYALLVALALLGACASDTDTVDEAAPNTSASAEEQAPVDTVITVEPATETDATAGTVAPSTARPVPSEVPALAPALGRAGSWVMTPQTDSNKPQPQPWLPGEQGATVVADPTAPGQVRNIR